MAEWVCCVVTGTAMWGCVVTGGVKDLQELAKASSRLSVNVGSM